VSILNEEILSGTVTKIYSSGKNYSVKISKFNLIPMLVPYVDVYGNSITHWLAICIKVKQEEEVVRCMCYETDINMNLYSEEPIFLSDTDYNNILEACKSSEDKFSLYQKLKV
jgi:hypothetical protein